MRLGPAQCTLSLVLLATVASAREAGQRPSVDVEQAVVERIGAATEIARPPANEDERDVLVGQLLRGELDPDAAVRVALLANPSVRAELAEAGVARADLLEAGLLPNPVFEIEYRHPHDPLEYHAFEDVTRIFQRALRRRTASATYEQRKLEIAGRVVDLVSSVRAAFFRLQAADQVARFQQAMLEAAQTSVDLARRQLEAGNITDRQMEMEQAEYEQQKLDLAAADTDAQVAREELTRLMGTEGAWTVETALPEPPKEEPSLEALVATARARRLDLAAAGRQAEAAQLGLRLARAERAPDVTVGLHYEREPEGTGTVGPSIGVSIPIFNHGQAGVARANALIAQAEALQSAAAATVSSEVRAAYIRLTAARDRVAYYREVILPRRGRIVQEAKVEFNAMLLGAFDLVAAKQGETRAHREQVEALRDYWLARVELDRAVGGTPVSDAVGEGTSE